MNHVVRAKSLRESSFILGFPEVIKIFLIEVGQRLISDTRRVVQRRLTEEVGVPILRFVFLLVHMGFVLDKHIKGFLGEHGASQLDSVCILDLLPCFKLQRNDLFEVLAVLVLWLLHFLNRVSSSLCFR